MQISCGLSRQFRYYSSGVFTLKSGTGLHAMTIVGYGQLAGTSIWIVRNSWGTSWGQAVFMSFSYTLLNKCYLVPLFFNFVFLAVRLRVMFTLREVKTFVILPRLSTVRLPSGPPHRAINLYTCIIFLDDRFSFLHNFNQQQRQENNKE